MQSLVANIVSKIIVALLAGVAAKYGLTANLSSLAVDVGALVGMLAAGYWAHTSIVADVLDYTPGNSANTSTPTKGASGLMKLLLFIALPTVLLAGCVNPNVKHGGAAVSNGWTAGIGENPATGLYELKVGNADAAGVIVPIFYSTNATGGLTVVCPDVVLSNEKGAKATLFGSGSSTYTIAWGPNATSSILGGQHYPINSPYWTNSANGLQAPGAPSPTTASTSQTVTNGVTNILTQTSSPVPTTQTTSGAGAAVTK